MQAWFSGGEGSRATCPWLYCAGYYLFLLRVLRALRISMAELGIKRCVSSCSHWAGLIRSSTSPLLRCPPCDVRKAQDEFTRSIGPSARPEVAKTNPEEFGRKISWVRKFSEHPRAGCLRVSRSASTRRSARTARGSPPYSLACERGGPARESRDAGAEAPCPPAAHEAGYQRSHGAFL
jgi:hypothetical protein